LQVLGYIFGEVTLTAAFYRQQAGRTALAAACYNGHADVAKLLIDEKADTSIPYEVMGALSTLVSSPVHLLYLNLFLLYFMTVM
jgi:ankyrin repeat protein